MFRDLSVRLSSAPREINKFQIVRTVLERLNANGEAALRERREILYRVVKFTNFDSCWPHDQLKAKGLVASIRDVMNQKDSLSRVNLAHKQERRDRLAEIQRASRENQERILNKHGRRLNA